MIKSFRHKGLEKFFTTGSKAGIQPHHAVRLRIQLSELNGIRSLSDVKVESWDLRPLQGALANHWSIKVNGNWRLTFQFDEMDVVLVDYQDYH